MHQGECNMPGMFGIVSRNLEERNKFYEIFKSHVPFHYTVRRASNCHIGSHAFHGTSIFEDQQRIVAVDGESGIYDALADSPDVLYKHKDGKITTGTKCKGNLCVLDKENNTLYLAADLLGCFPLYYTITKNSFIFSNRLRSLGKHLTAKHDITGISEFFLTGYTFNNRTLYQNILRLRPGEIVRLNIHTLELDVGNYSNLWVVRANNQSQDNIIEHATELLLTSFDIDQKTLLMMSAGWDSRTMLAASLANNKISKLTAYSHGDLGSREIKIIDRIAKTQDVNFYRQSVDAKMFAMDVLHKNLDYTENVVFPHWHCAGERANELGIRQVTAGIFGEAFGGHYGPPMVLSGASKIISTGKYILNLQSSAQWVGQQEEALQKAKSLLRFTNIKKPWFVSDDFWESNYGQIFNLLNEDIELVLKRYKNRGIATPENFIEAFITEHRGSQYINAQLLSCRHHVNVCLPFADRDFIEFAASLPFSLKVHNILNQTVISRIAPELLKFPMAATLLPAKYPVILQEASRATRKFIEGIHWKVHKTTKGVLGEPRMGWTNFQFLADSNKLYEIIDSLKQPYWDKKKMKFHIDNIKYESYHPASDMLMKILSIDYCLDI
jgi:asparagine synthetase B (glutamine-hydrolysing)